MAQQPSAVLVTTTERPAAKPTGEVFRDPTSGKMMRVYEDPATGKREYREEP